MTTPLNTVELKIQGMTCAACPITVTRCVNT